MKLEASTVLFVAVILVSGVISAKNEEALIIEVQSPTGNYVNSKIPIHAKAHGARLSGGDTKPTINDDVLVPYNDPEYQRR